MGELSGFFPPPFTEAFLQVSAKVHCLGAEKPPPQKPLWGGLSNFRVHGKQHPPKERQAGLFLGGDVKKRGGDSGVPFGAAPLPSGGVTPCLERDKNEIQLPLFAGVYGGGSSPPLRRRRDSSTKPGAPANSVPRSPLRAGSEEEPTLGPGPFPRPRRASSRPQGC